MINYFKWLLLAISRTRKHVMRRIEDFVGYLIVSNENNARRARIERLLPTHIRPLYATDGDGVLTCGPRARETREKIRRTINYNIVLIIGRSAIATRVGVIWLYCRERTNRPASGEYECSFRSNDVAEFSPLFHGVFAAIKTNTYRFKK